MRSFVMKDGTVVDRDLVWTSCHRRRTKIKDMEDSYLANLYDFLIHRRNKVPSRCEGWLFDNRLMIVIRELQYERGLKDEYMDRAQIPYKNPDDMWEIWDHDAGPQVLEEAVV